MQWLLNFFVIPAISRTSCNVTTRQFLKKTPTLLYARYSALYNYRDVTKYFALQHGPTLACKSYNLATKIKLNFQYNGATTVHRYQLHHFCQSSVI